MPSDCQRASHIADRLYIDVFMDILMNMHWHLNLNLTLPLGLKEVGGIDDDEVLALGRWLEHIHMQSRRY